MPKIRTNFFSVSKEKCIKCKTCVAMCPIRIITINEQSGFPEWVVNGEKACINCGHCVCVCPKAALSLGSMPIERCQLVNKDWKISPDGLRDFLKSRRSIRVYKKDEVARPLVEKIIGAASYAPSGINRQPVRWAVVYERDKAKQLSELVIKWMRSLVENKSPFAESLHFDNIIKMYENGVDPVLRGAPHVIIAYALKDDMTAAQSCTIALTYLELMAASLGLGACWAGYLSIGINASEDIRKFIGMSNKTASFGAMMVGYPKYNFSRIPLRNEPHVIWR